MEAELFNPRPSHHCPLLFTLPAAAADDDDDDADDDDDVDDDDDDDDDDEWLSWSISCDIPVLFLRCCYLLGAGCPVIGRPG